MKHDVKSPPVSFDTLGFQRTDFWCLGVSGHRERGDRLSRLGAHSLRQYCGGLPAPARFSHVGGPFLILPDIFEGRTTKYQLASFMHDNLGHEFATKSGARVLGSWGREIGTGP